MKILFRGTPPEEKQYVATCGHCKSQLEFPRHEARESSGRNETLLTVQCPICKRDVVVNA